MDEALARIKARRTIDDHPYFTALADQTFAREDFLETQIQFLFAVVFFSRPMTVLAGRLPRPEMRVTLLDNVGDEHGRGNLRLSHERTFLALLAKLGATPDEIEARALWPEVRAFNTTLAGVTMLDDPLTGLAMMGIIEDLFSRISARIGRSIIDNRWLEASEIVHYATHERLDQDHAEGFYSLIRAPYAEHPRHAYQVEQGLELGHYVFLRLYEDLWRSRARRATRAIRGPHSASDGWYLDP